MFNDRRIMVLLLLPAATLFAVLAVWPSVRVILLSFFATDYGLSGAKFVGWENYRDLLTDPLFQRSIVNTVVFSLSATAAEVTLGFGLALLFHRPFRARSICLPLMILPYVISTMVSASIWRSWFHYDFGFLNNVFALIGLPRIAWLSSASAAMPAIVLMDIWQATAFPFLIILAGLQSIPKEIREASFVDGATPFVSLVHITLPMLKRYILLAFLLRTIDTFKVFDKIFVTTKGGPGTATEVLSLSVYKYAFRFSDIGFASASATILLVIGFLLAVLYGWKTVRRPVP